MTLRTRPRREVYGPELDARSSGIDDRVRTRHSWSRGLLIVVAIVMVGLLAGCSSSGSDDDAALPETPVQQPTLDEVVQRRTSTVRLGASPGRRPGQTPLEGLETIEVVAGRQLDYVRAYVNWDGEFPDQRHLAIAAEGRALHLSISPRRLDDSRVQWADIAEAKFGEPLFEEIQAWVTAVAMFDGELFITFHHEAEIELGFGGADDFVAAWQRMATDISARAPQVETIWVVTGGRLGDASIDEWYPGDDTVDRIGMDVFNWYGCRGDDEPWKTAQEALSPLIAFGAKHPDKPLVIAEIGSDEDDAQPGRKAGWYDEFAELLSTAAYERITMVSFFSNRQPGDTSCEWWVDSSPLAAGAFTSLANREIFGGQDAAPAVARCTARLRIPGEVTDEALVDLDADGVVDVAFGGDDRFVGIGDQSGDGRVQRVILRFPPLGTQVGADEKVELRVRLGQRAEQATSNVALSHITRTVTFGLDAFDAEAQRLSEDLMTPASTGGYHTADVTAAVASQLPSAFRLELVDPTGPTGGAYIIGMAEANNEADRPTLVVRTC